MSKVIFSTQDVRPCAGRSPPRAQTGRVAPGGQGLFCAHSQNNNAPPIVQKLVFFQCFAAFSARLHSLGKEQQFRAPKKSFRDRKQGGKWRPRTGIFMTWGGTRKLLTRTMEAVANECGLSTPHTQQDVFATPCPQKDVTSQSSQKPKNKRHNFISNNYHPCPEFHTLGNPAIVVVTLRIVTAAASSIWGVV